MSDDSEAAARAAFRAFVRAHHPDVGGDPDFFAAGVAELRATQRRAASEQDDHYDAPIIYVGKARGFRGWVRRFRERRSRRSHGHRVE
jgi:hypothetical protein